MPVFAPSLSERVHFQEQMDDLSRDDAQLRRALFELRNVNVFLGGHRTLRKCLVPFLEERIGTTVTILDLGSGLADHPEKMVRWGDEIGVEVRVTALDANPVVVACARKYLDDRLSPTQRERVRVLQADARELSFADDSYDVVTASLFLHHFDEADCTMLLTEMSRVALSGIVINDLYRHHLAYLGISTIAGVFPVTEMFANDGPLSVRRAFRPRELERMADEAGLKDADVTRRWAFRLSLSTL